MCFPGAGTTQEKRSKVLEGTGTGDVTAETHHALLQIDWTLELIKISFNFPSTLLQTLCKLQVVFLFIQKLNLRM